MPKAATLCLFAVALGAYLALWPDAPVMEGDSPQYLEVARDLSDLRLDALHDRTPGYPVLLALAGSRETPTRSLFVLSLLLHFAAIWMLAAVLRSTGVGRLWLVMFCCLLLLPPYVEPAAHVMTETLAQFMLVLGFACLVGWFSSRRQWLLAVSALAFAGSALTRPIYQAIAPAIAACLVIAPIVMRSARSKLRDGIAAGAVLLAGSLLVLGGLAYANRVKFGFFGVAPSLGFHVSTKTMSFIERLPDEYAAVREILVRERDAQLVRRGGTHTGTQTIWSVRSELSAATGLSRPELSRYLLRMNLELIAKAPMEYLQEVARSMAVYWFPAAGPLASMGSSVLRWLWAIVHVVLVSAFFLQLVVFIGVAVFDASRQLASRGTYVAMSPLRASALQVLAYFTAGSIVFYTMLLSCAIDIGETRQRRPTEALFIFMCFLGAHVWQRTAGPGTERGA